FTYGPLAHFLKNRVYIGETGHKDKWFPGEHAAIIERKTFDQVQQLLASKPAGRKTRRTASEALLMGKLYDDRGNRMSPSFSNKNGVRYRFYVSSALLRGRKTEAGSVARVSPVASVPSLFSRRCLMSVQGGFRCGKEVWGSGSERNPASAQLTDKNSAPGADLPIPPVSSEAAMRSASFRACRFLDSDD